LKNPPNPGKLVAKTTPEAALMSEPVPRPALQGNKVLRLEGFKVRRLEGFKV
jgi:hypothetical protein